mmetsp:Transcript_25401/g.56003  ORF Transcript_25401/g.56003 Transcript_25401/m.56003 type:complete len:694 (+) Transcript_25401:69-2150(+)
MRTVLLTQVGDLSVGCDEDMCRALSIEEGLLARLASVESMAEVSSILKTCWSIAAQGFHKRPQGMPESMEVLNQGIASMTRRLNAEVLSRATGKEDPKRDPAYAQAERQLVDEETAAVEAAKDRAESLRRSSLEKLKKELSGASEQGQGVLGVAKKAVEHVSNEVAALQAMSDREAKEAEATLRAERENIHAQTTSLHHLSLTMQIEKERLDQALTDRKPRKVVFDHILSKVKEMQAMLKEQEVNGTANRKSQGLMAHTLRALESRATKGLEEALVKMRSEGRIPGMDGTELPDFTPSKVIRSKQEKFEEQEKLFREGLEKDVAKQQAELAAKVAKEIAVLGATLSREAEVHTEALLASTQRLTAWRSGAERARPWLSELLPMARSNAVVAAASDRMRVAFEAEPGHAPTIRAVLKRFQALSAENSKAPEAQSPRAPGIDRLVKQLQDLSDALNKLGRKYPDVKVEAPAEEVQPKARPAPEPIEVAEESPMKKSTRTPSKKSAGAKLKKGTTWSGASPGAEPEVESPLAAGESPLRRSGGMILEEPEDDLESPEDTPQAAAGGWAGLAGLAQLTGMDQQLSALSSALATGVGAVGPTLSVGVAALGVPGTSGPPARPPNGPPGRPPVTRPPAKPPAAKAAAAKVPTAAAAAPASPAAKSASSPEKSAAKSGAKSAAKPGKKPDLGRSRTEAVR